MVTIPAEPAGDRVAVMTLTPPAPVTLRASTAGASSEKFSTAVVVLDHRGSAVSRERGDRRRGRRRLTVVASRNGPTTPSMPARSRSRWAATRSSNTWSSTWAATWCASRRPPASPAPAATWKCTASTLPTPDSTLSSGSSWTTQWPTASPASLYKGALQGKDAHSVWVGDVLIRKEAEGTDTYETNRNLILTDGARADSVPNLEIETGYRRCRPRQRHRPLRRRAAVLPAGTRHPRGRRPPPGGARLPQRNHPADPGSRPGRAPQRRGTRTRRRATLMTETPRGELVCNASTSRSSSAVRIADRRLSGSHRQGLRRRTACHRGHLFARGHLAVRRRRRRHHHRMLGPRHQVRPAHRRTAEPAGVRARPGLRAELDGDGVYVDVTNVLNGACSA